MWNSAALKEELPNNFYRFSHESSAHSRLLQEKGEKNLNFFLPFYANFILSSSSFALCQYKSNYSHQYMVWVSLHDVEADMIWSEVKWSERERKKGFFEKILLFFILRVFNVLSTKPTKKRRIKVSREDFLPHCHCEKMFSLLTQPSRWLCVRAVKERNLHFNQKCLCERSSTLSEMRKFSLCCWFWLRKSSRFFFSPQHINSTFHFCIFFRLRPDCCLLLKCESRAI